MKTAMVIALILATSVGCGQQASPTAPPAARGPSSPVAPSPAQPSNIVPAANGDVRGVYRSDVVMSRSGTATVTLTWPDGDYNLQLYVTSATCAGTASLLTGACNVLGATRPGTRPGLVTSPVTGGEANTIWVLNTEPAPQSFTVSVEIK